MPTFRSFRPIQWVFVIGCFQASLAYSASAVDNQLDHPFGPPVSRKVDIVTYRFDKHTYTNLRNVHDSNQLVVLRGVTLPEGSADLQLRPIKNAASAAQVIHENGTTSFQNAQVRCFTGIVAGTQRRVFLGVAPDFLHGTIDGSEPLYLSTGRPPAAQQSTRTLYISTASAVSQESTNKPWRCGMKQHPEHRANQAVRSVASTPPTIPQLRFTDVFLECDPQYVQLFSGTQESIDYTTLLVTASSEIYRRDLGIVLRVPLGYMRVWETKKPWDSGFDFGVYSFIGYWSSANNPLKDIPRASVFWLRPFVGGSLFGAAADFGGLCTQDLGYQFAYLSGFFPYPIEHTHPNNLDLLLMAHEFGHTYGAYHTFDVGVSCQDGSGPDNGTIMSYCHTDPGGVVNVGMRFHTVLQEDIRDYVDQVATCENIQLITAGDYNGDGFITLTDLAAATACLNQQFDSAGCDETFDLDVDGDFDQDDVDLLALLAADCNNNGQADASDIAQGSSTDCNSNSTPDECELDCNSNGQPDDCDITTQFSNDCDGNGIPDECEPDCNSNGQSDICDVNSGASVDCNYNSVPDDCEPEFHPDCNGNGISDFCDLPNSTDCNFNTILDDCELDGNDCNSNGVPDDCDITAGILEDCDQNKVPDICETPIDCNGNGTSDACDITNGDPDYNSNGIPDSCESNSVIHVNPDPAVCNPTGTGALDDPVCTIADGIKHSINGDTVLLEDGTYPVIYSLDLDTTNSNPLYSGPINREITLRSRNGYKNCKIESAGQNVILRLWSPKTSATRIIGIHFKGGHSEYGGAMHLRSAAAPTISHCYFEGNSSTNGGALYLEGGTNLPPGPIIENSVFMNNSAAVRGGAIASFERGDLRIRNCTFLNNTASSFGSTIYALEATNMEVDNSIVWNSTSTTILQQIYLLGDVFQPNTLTVTNSNVQGGASGIGGFFATTQWIDGLDSDPFFVDEVGGDLHLSPNSPCIDAGLSTVALASEHDLDYQPRLLGQAIDIGADETIPAGELVISHVTPGVAGTTNTVSITGATPNIPIFFVYAATPGSFPIPGCGTLQLGLANPQLGQIVIADASGNASITEFINVAPQGAIAYIQALDFNVCTASNVVSFSW